MGEEYRRIERIESEIFDWLKAAFLKERKLFSRMLELVLEAFKPLGEYREETAEDELALLTLATRMFNDAEGTKQLLLWGLPDQAQPLMRDMIECMLMLRLFLRRPEMAKKWLMELTEYRPGTINAKLSELGVHAREYAWYGVLSHLGHSNLLATLSHAQEVDLGEQGMLRRFHFGSARTPEAERCIQWGFLTLFFLLYVALNEPLAELYCGRSESDASRRWHARVGDLRPQMLDLFRDVAEQPVSDTSEVGRCLRERTERKLRLEEFKRILTGEDPLPPRD